MHLPLLTNSRASSYCECPLKHHYGYNLGYRSIGKSFPLQFGSISHYGQEGWWAHGVTGDARLENGLRFIAIACDKEELNEFDRVRAEEVLRGYHFRWVDEQDANIQTVHVEQIFQVPLIHPITKEHSQHWDLGGMIDKIAIVRGVEYIVEHKCLAGSTRIFDHETGRQYTIEELEKHCIAPLVTGMDANGNLVKARAKPPIAQPKQNSVKVTTKGGRTLTASANHPMWTRRGWIGAGELTSDDYVAIPKSMPSDAERSKLPNEVIRLIGYVLGDGSLTRSSIMVTKNNERFLSDVQLGGETLGDRGKLYFPEDKPSYVMFRGGGAVDLFFKELGLHGHLSATKFIPHHLNLSDAQCGQLLGALWSADGCIDVYREKRSGGRTSLKPRIIYTSVSKQLCIDIQHLLQRLGIVSTVRTSSVTYNGGRVTTYNTCVISREAKRRFLNLVIEGTIHMVRSSVAPQEALAAISNAKQGADMPFQSGAIWWDEVVSVTNDEEQVLYDIEVPGIHTFVANGMLTHNTSSEDFGPGSDYQQRTLLSTQVSQYWTAGKAMGHDIKGCLYDVMRRPSIKPLKATPEENRKYKKNGELYANCRAEDETPEEFRVRLRNAIAEDPEKYYQRWTVVRLEHEEVQATIDMFEVGNMMAESIRTGVHPQFGKRNGACKRFGSACTYLGVCSGFSDLEDPTKFRKVEEVNEELA